MDSEDATQEEKKFIRWLAGQSVECPSCRIAGQTPSSGGRGVLATHAISHGEIVVAVPDAAVLMVDNGVIAEVSVS